jgi:hypothetical protein
LGDRLVTQGVGELSANEVAAALDAGDAVAHLLVSAGLIHSAALNLQGETRIVDLDQFSSPVRAEKLWRKPWIGSRNDRVPEGRRIIHA